MPTPKRGTAAKGGLYQKEDESSPLSSPRRKANDAVSPRGARGRVESPTKSGHETPTRKPRTTEDVRAEAFPIVPRGRGRPPSNKGTPVASKIIADSAASPARRSRRNTEQTGDEDIPSSSRSRLDSQSTTASKKSPPQSPTSTPRRRTTKSEMELAEELSEGTVYDEGRGKRKRKLTEAAEASQAQSRSRKNSRRISERTDQHLEEMEPIHEEELTEPIEEEIVETEEHEFVDEVAHEELVHAVSPQDMYMQAHIRPLHAGMGAPRTRGMHVVPDNEELLGELVEEEEAMDEMIIYDDMFEGDELAHEEIIEGEEEIDQREMDMMQHHAMDQMHHHHSQQQQGGHEMVRRQSDMAGRRQIIVQQQPQEIKREEGGENEGEEDDEDDDDDDDLPPQLEPEEGPAPEEILMHETMERGGRGEQMGQLMDPYEDQHYMTSPGGTQYMAADDDLYVDGVDGQGGMLMAGDGEEGQERGGAGGPDLRTVEFNFLDNKNVCCGLCGDIVPYESLLSEHLPMQHPEVYGEQGAMDLEEISYDSWLKDKLYHEKKSLENGFRTMGYEQPQGTSAMSRMGRNRVLRRVSQVRVNPGLMSLAQLNSALQKKMIEKMGRRVKVSLVDKQHARCGICSAVVSLNKKFEVVHLVRHFNAWHPSVHRCSGNWPTRSILNGPGKPLSGQDFAVVDQALDAAESLQCIWCGMFMDRTMLAMHFHEVHPDDVEVPKCHLCLQEVVINARLLEKYGQDFGISLPDEHHIKCRRLNDKTFSTEAALDRFIERRKERMEAVESGEMPPIEDEDDATAAEDEEEAAAVRRDHSERDPQYSNSRMAFGRRNKPKRNFIMPSLRQAIPQDSRFVEALNEGEWRCKICNESILAAVISAGAIKHFRLSHPTELEEMQYELCKARLERVSDGCMEFVNAEMIECLICNLTYALHKPYNMCRGIRHLKTKHPHMMPEFHSRANTQTPGINLHKKVNKYKAFDHSQLGGLGGRLPEMGEFVDDPEVINKLKQEYDYDFDKVQAMYTAEGERVLVLVTDGQEIDQQVAENIQASIVNQPREGDEDDEEEEDEEGVIVEEEGEYPMEGEIVVRGDDGHLETVQLGAQRHQMVIMEDVEEEDEERPADEQEEGAEEGQEGEEGEEQREEMVEEEAVNEGQQFQ